MDTVAPANRNPVVITGEARFTSMEELALHSSDWDLDFIQLSPGQFESGAVLYCGRNVSIRYVTYNRRFHQRGTPPPGMFTFGILDDPQHHIANGQALQRGSILRFNTPGGLDVVAEAGFAGFPISIQEAFMYEVAEQVDLTVSTQQLSGEAVLSVPSPAALESLRGELYTLIGAIRGGSRQFLSTTWAEDFEFSIVASLLGLLAESECRSAPHYQSIRYRGLRKAVQHIRQKGQEPLTIKELCGVANVSWRTLDRAFREHFDITAKHYLNNHRLHQVHRQLLVADPGTRIIDIASNWGFFHPGQFAADYRRCFGELPRQTAQSGRKKG